MDQIKQLLQEWEAKAAQKYVAKEFSVRIPVTVAAQVRALCDLYPGRTENQILADLLTAALNELEEAMPYVKGSKVIAEDEFGDPIYEDVGPTPRFEALTQKYLKELQADSELNTN
jgi:hypothetical protein